MFAALGILASGTAHAQEANLQQASFTAPASPESPTTVAPNVAAFTAENESFVDTALTADPLGAAAPFAQGSEEELQMYAPHAAPGGLASNPIITRLSRDNPISVEPVDGVQVGVVKVAGKDAAGVSISREF